MTTKAKVINRLFDYLCKSIVIVINYIQEKLFSVVIVNGKIESNCNLSD